MVVKPLFHSLVFRRWSIDNLNPHHSRARSLFCTSPDVRPWRLLSENFSTNLLNGATVLAGRPTGFNPLAFQEGPAAPKLLPSSDEGRTQPLLSKSIREFLDFVLGPWSIIAEPLILPPISRKVCIFLDEFSVFSGFSRLSPFNP